jgi:hypothetical protein
MIDIKDWITQERDAFKNMGIIGPGNGAWLMQEFLLRNGKKFYSQPKPRRYKMRTPKFCFHNSRMLFNQSHGALRYAEGYVASPGLPLLIHHAWCVDARDRVIDVTLQNYDDETSRAGEAQYFGLTFEKKLVNAISPNSGSMLDSGHGFRIDLWLAIDPGFEAILDGALKFPPKATK